MHRHRLRYGSVVVLRRLEDDGDLAMNISLGEGAFGLPAVCGEEPHLDVVCRKTGGKEVRTSSCSKMWIHCAGLVICTFLNFVTQQENLVPSLNAAAVPVDPADPQLCRVRGPWRSGDQSDCILHVRL